MTDLVLPNHLSRRPGEAPAFGPGDWIEMAHHRLRIHEGNIDVLRRFKAQTIDMVRLLKKHEDERDRVLDLLARAYAKLAPDMLAQADSGERLEKAFASAFGEEEAKGGAA